MTQIWSFFFFTTLQYKTEKDGVVETRIERKIIISSEGDDIDHDEVSFWCYGCYYLLFRIPIFIEDKCRVIWCFVCLLGPGSCHPLCYRYEPWPFCGEDRNSNKVWDRCWLDHVHKVSYVLFLISELWTSLTRVLVCYILINK